MPFLIQTEALQGTARLVPSLQTKSRERLAHDVDTFATHFSLVHVIDTDVLLDTEWQHSCWCFWVKTAACLHFLKFLPKERAHGDSSVQFSIIPAPTVHHHRVPTSCHKDTLGPNLFPAHPDIAFFRWGSGYKICSHLPRIFSLRSRQIDVLNDVGAIPLPKLLVECILPATQRTNQLYCYTDTYTTTNQLYCYTDTYTTTNQLCCYIDTYSTTYQLYCYIDTYTITNQLYCYTDTYAATDQLCCYIDTYATTNQLYCYTDTYTTINELYCHTDTYTTTNQLYCYTDTYTTTNQLYCYTDTYTTTNQLYCYTDTYTTTNQLCCYTDTYTTTNQLYCYIDTYTTINQLYCCTDTYTTTDQLCCYIDTYTTTNQLYCNITYTQQPVSFTVTLYTQQPIRCTVHIHSNQSAVLYTYTATSQLLLHTYTASKQTNKLFKVRPVRILSNWQIFSSMILALLCTMTNFCTSAILLGTLSIFIFNYAPQQAISAPFLSLFFYCAPQQAVSAPFLALFSTMHHSKLSVHPF